MEEEFDEFFNINQLLMEQNTDMQEDSNSSNSMSDSTESTNQQQTESIETRDSELEADEEQHVPNNARQSRALNIQEKRQIVNDIMLNVEGDSLPRGVLSIGKKTWCNEGDVVDVRSKKLGKIGRKPKEYSDEWLMSVPLYKRTTNRSYGAALNVHHVIIHRLKKKGRLRSVTVTNHSTLSDNYKLARLKWVLQHINPVPSEGDPTFGDMQYYIHIDEKWFYLNPKTRTFYLTPNEEVPVADPGFSNL
ncbi:uncharacterized protein LOC110703872 [Chenopodium quinoa]|uniref:uncharacterized protein LOC110703872 n=1 Tax=Chenopodium quinoa TaxID=63459 RepID=UPI000B78D091|nr:uncharacterized protein LOC110703872 [Chenopodium quinoa]